MVGAAFRQSKVLFEYMETIWRNSPMLRDVCDSDSGPRRDTDRCVLKLNDSTITCLPLGDGQKIRGQRANDIIADEFASIPREIFENVVAGFAAVSADPVENVKRLAARRVFLGFTIAVVLAIAIGVPIGMSRKLKEFSFPVLEIIRPIPPLAWLPISILFWPSSELTMVFLTFLGAFFPILINILAGIDSIEQVCSTGKLKRSSGRSCTVGSAA